MSRLRPILVTSMTTFGGVIPTAYGIGGYDAVMSPMSLALGWGLAFSTFVTLFLVPALYVTANDINRRIDVWRVGATGTAAWTEEPALALAVSDEAARRQSRLTRRGRRGARDANGSPVLRANSMSGAIASRSLR